RMKINIFTIILLATICYLKAEECNDVLEKCTCLAIKSKGYCQAQGGKNCRATCQFCDISDDPVCKFIARKDCSDIDVSKKCPKYCKPDGPTCPFIPIEKCTEVAVKGQCPLRCSPPPPPVKECPVSQGSVEFTQTVTRTQSIVQTQVITLPAQTRYVTQTTWITTALVGPTQIITRTQNNVQTQVITSTRVINRPAQTQYVTLTQTQTVYRTQGFTQEPRPVQVFANPRPLTFFAQDLVQPVGAINAALQ
ncbi:unnamed protein product, partial [Meganyctiphanes norvegica]